MEALIQEICKVWRPEWQGIAIARIYYWRAIKEQQFDHIDSFFVEVKANRSITLSCKKMHEDQIVESIEVKMIHPRGWKEKKERLLPVERKKWRNFSKTEVWAYSKRVGDHNLIHLTENPVVQGFLLLGHLADTFPQAEEYRISFCSPALAEEDIYLHTQDQTFCGYGETTIYFTGTAGKRRNEA